MQTKQPFSMWTYPKLRALAYPGLGPSVVALGTFDGVHLGHRHIVSEAARRALQRQIKAVALTFDCHPKSILTPGDQPPLITPLLLRVQRLYEAGMSHSVVIRFDLELARVSAERFVEEVIHNALGARAVVVGYNFRFGAGARGDIDLLQHLAPTYGYTLHVVAPVVRKGEPVSSTRIRRLLQTGDIEAANELLGAPFALSGRVVAGDARGRVLGFPTANLELDPEALRPHDGVYLSDVRVVEDDDSVPPQSGRAFGHPALTVISDRPSFDGATPSIESFLLNFDGDLYGKRLHVTLHRRLRDIVRFASADQLKAQIAQDVEAAHAFFQGSFTP